MDSILGDDTGPGGPGPSRCILLLQRSLAIQLTRGPPSQAFNPNQCDSTKEHPADEMWMYDKGYNLFQVKYSVSCRLVITIQPCNLIFLLSFSHKFEKIVISTSCKSYIFANKKCQRLRLIYYYHFFRNK